MAITITELIKLHEQDPRKAAALKKARARIKEAKQ